MLARRQSVRTALLLLILSVSAAPAQEGMAGRLLGELGGALTEGQKSEQRKRLKELEVYALQKGGRGSPEYNAIIRAGMANMRWEGQGEGRSLGSGSEATNPERLRWKTHGIDRNVQTSRLIREALKDGMEGARVIGGKPVPKSFAETVALKSKGDAGREFFCTGVLISEGAVLTAAHCACDMKERREPTVVFGEKADTSNYKMRVGVDRTILFDPNFCDKKSTLGDDYIRGNDLAVLLLKSDLTVVDPLKAVVSVLDDTPFVSPRVIALGKEPVVKGNGNRLAVAPARLIRMSDVNSPWFSELVVVGFGINNNAELEGPGYKVAAAVTVSSRICGWPLDKANFRCALGREIVAIDYRGRDTCGGDSGGPAFILRPDRTYNLAGITSRAVSSSGACGAGGIYTLITPAVVKWLNETLDGKIYGASD